MPSVLIAGALLRDVGNVSPSVPNAAALRLKVVAHGVACDDPVAERPPLSGAASALACTGPGGTRLRLAAFANPAARAAAPLPSDGLVVSGANWRVELPADSRAVAARLATALPGRVG